MANTSFHLFADSASVVAVGPGTAAGLEARGVGPVVSPPGHSGSEELLVLPELRRVSGKRILILRGQDGRELLAEELTRRGAEVEYAGVYRRRRVAGAAASTILGWLDSADPVLVLTSVAALESLLTLVPATRRRKLLAVPVAAIGERIAEACRQAGWVAPVAVADETSDAGLVRASVSVHPRVRQSP